ncbi:MAG: hypothetical protein ACWA5P_06730 [bacterium]
MNKLTYCISLREKGLDSKQIKEELNIKGYSQKEIDYYLRKSDDIFLNNTIKSKKGTPQTGNKHSLKMLVLILSLILLVLVFYGYLEIGLLGIFILWSAIGYGAFKRRGRNFLN